MTNNDEAFRGGKIKARFSATKANVVSIEDARANGAARDEKDEVENLIAEFNARYFVVNENGRAIIYEPTFDPLMKRKCFNRITFEDFKKLYLNKRVRVVSKSDGSSKQKAAADVWLRHPARKQYLGGVMFDPSGAHIKPHTLNLWQGFAVKPRAGSWEKLRTHVFENICCGNREHFDYLMGWMARLAQKPAEQGEVAVVLKGGEGTGKGTLAKALTRIFGQHAMTVASAKHLTGSFNGHLRDAVFLFADEAFFAGDKSHVGVLKSLITEPVLSVEEKFKNAIQAPNFIHLMLASNEQWVIPASLDARRFFVLEVSNKRANDHQYFEAIWSELEAGGFEAMLHDLLAYDLTAFNHRKPPATQGLKEQRKLSLDTAHSWWADVLHRGFVFKSQLGLEDHFEQWRDEASTKLIFDSYEAFANSRRERRLLSREALGKFLSGFGINRARRRNVVTGERITSVRDDYGSLKRKAELITTPRDYVYVLRSLDEARATFENATGLTFDWPKDEEEGGP
jgi:hypothetical protein